ncbi:S-layer homology domain-containing protein [Paenibacillus sp. PL2-23]|uniref:S-layer homology domain-containing protein n=1 Tax=Paenibacillus sp. PL2-23 TaxID=2100729 RepID=UPI0030FACB73
MKRLALLATGFALVLAALQPPTANDRASAAVSASIFSDTRGHWAEPTINEMVSRGILEGYADGTFRPEEPVKVDQFVKMLILSYSDLHPNGSRSWDADFVGSLSLENQAILKQDYRYFTFKPSTSGYWAKEFISIASDLHFLNKDRYVDFQADMTRENVAEVIYYTLQETEFLEDSSFGQKMAQSYGDITSATDREQRFIAEALVKGIMEGYPNGFFGVGQKVTRAQALILLERLTDKSKRKTVKVSPDKLERIVPTEGGGTKIIIFPDKRMWDAYESLLVAAGLRGTNQDLFGTTLRLYKDQAEKDSVRGGTAGASVSSAINEEASIWLDPQYNTYGVTMRLREGSLARNMEVVEQFANGLFGYNAIAFKQLFSEVCAKVEKGESIIQTHAVIGTDSISILIDSKQKQVIFSIAAKSS